MQNDLRQGLRAATDV